MGSKVRLGDITQSVSSPFDFDSHPEFVLINTGDVERGIVLNHEKCGHDSVKGQFKKAFCRNDLLYSEIRPCNKHFAFIDFEASDYVASTKLMVIRCDETRVRPRYLFNYLASEFTIAYLQMIAESRSGTFPQITYQEIARLEIALPSLELQDHALSVIDSINEKISVNNRINDYLAA